jgi:DNA-binding IclR family transcriptional regulator
MTDKQYLNSLRRGLETLSILNVKDSLTGSELARRLNIQRTTAHRILETLASEGFVTHDLEGRCFRLSAKVRHIAFGFNRDGLVSEIARPILQSLCRETSMPVGLTTPVGPSMVIQVSTDHDAPLALEQVREGATFPLTLGASGHIFLAHCTREVRTALLANCTTNDPNAISATTLSDEEFDRIRRLGYAISPARAQWIEGLVAVPVYLEGEYVASAHIRYMRRVVGEARVVQTLLPKLRTAVAEIELQLAGQAHKIPTLFTSISRDKSSID